MSGTSDPNRPPTFFLDANASTVWLGPPSIGAV